MEYALLNSASNRALVWSKIRIGGFNFGVRTTCQISFMWLNAFSGYRVYTVRFPSREQRSHEKKSAAPFDIGSKQRDSCTWTSLTRRAQEKGLHTEGCHNTEESITVSEHISGTLWCHS
ncbi:hypothetical protein AVEN_216418-1 [Araneus ventricosus]|uniref:Uncharacterized protein n=1 Tax=Araneus ventricosus TaxID=182803 RepID=A0A4Y2H2E2_ARAVE|nr:hypothetical protein AVEN_216418-1 [Araneus ventricosus]